ncbi:MAG: glycosyltransferase family 2 protein [Alphaproteobacteria bacterium]|nr:glycosyltransferase family 2 protein [Alphaproteobacteria bacterium]
MPFQSANAMLDASVIVCTHNPRSDYFDRVLDGLRHQTLPLHRWELLIVDNASRLPLASSCDISWHPTARHILESELGLAWARQRGIQEASADLIIFVDDDNVLDETYLAEAIKIKQEWPSLGVWGSGSIRGDLEVELPESLREHRNWLPLREVTAPRWSNLAFYEDAMPMGAGLCVRREIAMAYSQFLDQSSIQITDRLGESLVGKGDTEISIVCCNLGLGTGVFPELKLAHLIPRHRVSEEYFVRLAEGTYVSDFLLGYKWRHIIPQSPFSLRTLLSVLKTILLYRGVDRNIRLAWVRALAKAKRIIQTDGRKNNSQIYDMAARAPSNAPIAADREIS